MSGVKKGVKSDPVKGASKADPKKTNPKAAKAELNMSPEKPAKEEPTEKELLLKAELEAINKEMEDAKEKVTQLRHDNEWLQEETRKVRLENHEYMAYMEKKALKRQTAIISLSDHHQKELENLKKEEQLMKEDFEKKKAALMDEIMEQDNVLAKVNRELDDLHEYKVLQQEQTATINELEQQITALRVKHAEVITQMKAKFLAEKQEFQALSHQKVTSMTKQADKEATLCLNEHTVKVKEENRQLRKELLTLIRQTQSLQEQKRRLEEQRRELMVERQYAEDMRNVRVNRKERALAPGTADAATNGEGKITESLAAKRTAASTAAAAAAAVGGVSDATRNSRRSVKN